MKRPLAGVAIMFAAGILVDSLLVTSPTILWHGIAAIVFLGLFVVLRHTRWSLPVLMIAVATAGAMSHHHATNVVPPNHIGRFLTGRAENITVQGVIVTAPDESVTDYGSKRLRFVLAVEKILTGMDWQTTSGRLYVSVTGHPFRESPGYGCRIECSALVRGGSPPRNPGVFDMDAWLQRQGITASLIVRSTDKFAVLSTGHGNRIMAASLNLRQRLEQALKAGISDDPALAGILTGMVLGERSEIPPDAKQDFQRTGVFHVFSVSGLHVMLVSTVIVAMLFLVRIPRRWAGLVSIPLIILYVLATGARPGALRAMWMSCVLLAGWTAVRPADLLNSLSLAALALLVLDPRQLFDGGFVLSFGIVISLVILTPPIHARLGPLIEPDPLLPEVLIPRWRKKLLGPSRALMQLISGSLAAWLGMLPLMAIYFHLCTLTSIPANVVVIPMTEFVMAISIAAMGAYQVWPLLAEIFNNANWYLLVLMIKAVDWLDHIPYGCWYVRAPPLWATIGYYGALVGLVNGWFQHAWQRAGRGRPALVALPALGAGLWWMLAWPSATEITVLDLNQGTATFVDAPGSRHDLLIDTGGDAWSAKQVIIPFLRSQGVDRLGGIVATCALKSHLGGAESVAAEIPFDRAIHSGIGSASTYFKRWSVLVQTKADSEQKVRAGDRVIDSGNLQVDVLYPFADRTFSRSSDNALVLSVRVGSTRILMMSDAGATVEQLLLERHTDLRAQIIIKGENESEPSCTPAFLGAVQPELVIAAVSARDSRRYPHPDLRDRLKQSGIRYLRTDEDGAVTLRLTGNGYALETIRDRD